MFAFFPEKRVYGKCGLYVSILNEELIDELDLPERTELFIDGTHSVTEGDTQLLVVMTTTDLPDCPAVPIGYFIVTGSSAPVYMWALEILKRHGANPVNMHMDGELAEHEASMRTFPEAKIIFCKFHALQAWFRNFEGCNPGKTRNSMLWKLLKPLLVALLDCENKALMVKKKKRRQLKFNKFHRGISRDCFTGFLQC